MLCAFATSEQAKSQSDSEMCVQDIMQSNSLHINEAKVNVNDDKLVINLLH